MVDFIGFIFIVIVILGCYKVLDISFKKDSVLLLLLGFMLLGIILTCCSWLSKKYNKINDSNMKEKIENPIVNIEKQYKNYSRNFIRINPNEIMLIHMFKRDVDHQLEDAVLDDNQQYYEDITKIRKEAAHQLVLQFEGHSSRSFIKALKEECEEWLEEDSKRR